MSGNFVIGRWQACVIAALVVLATVSEGRANDLLGELLRQAGQQLLQAAPPPAAPQRPATSKPRRAQGGDTQPANAPDEGPSFSCTRKLRPTERAICASPELGRLDRKLAEAYMSAWTTADDRERAALKRDQRAWLARRAGCGANPGCIAGMLTQRTAELFDQSGATPAPEQPPAPGMADSGNTREPFDGPTSAQSGKAQGTGVVRDAPAADYRTLLAMVMNYRPDDYRSDDFAIYWYGWNLHSEDAECKAAKQSWQNPATRPQFVRDIRQRLDAVLAKATRAPSTRTLKLSIVADGFESGYDSAAGKLKLPSTFMRRASQDQDFAWSPGNAVLTFTPVSVDHCSFGSTKLSINMLGGLAVSLGKLNALYVPLRMEAAMKWLEQRGSNAGSFHTTIKFTLERIVDSPDKRYLVAVAHLESVTLTAPDGSKLAEIPLDSFPLAADRWNQVVGTASKAAEDAAKVKAEQARTEADNAAKASAAAASAMKSQRASVEAAAEKALTGPYGPDVVGIQLGMAFQEADAIIRKHMDIGWVVTNPATPMSKQPDPNIPDISSVRGYFSRDRSEVIVLLDMPPEAAGRVLGVTRRFNVAQGTSDSDIEAALVQKYGKPREKVTSPSTIWRWGGDNGVCSSPVGGMPRQPSIIEGPQPTGGGSASTIGYMSIYRFVFGQVGGHIPDLATWADCGPTIQVSRNSDRIDLALTDSRLYAAFLAHELGRNIKQSQIANPIKF